MENLYSSKQYTDRMENREIDLLEILKYMLEKWKVLLLSCVVLFLVFGTLAFFISSRPAITKDDLTKKQQKEVDKALELYEELDDMEKYEATSVYMKLNPYECNITTLQYLITDYNAAGNAFNMYKAFADSGSLKKIIEDKLGNEIENPSELVSYSAYEKSLLGENNDDTKLSQVISVKIVAADEEMNSKITQIVKDSFEEYRTYLQTVVADHDMQMLSEDNYVGTDQGILDFKDSFVLKMKDKQNQITEMESKLESEEKEVAEQLRDAQKDQEEIEPKNDNSLLKYLILAAMMSVFFPCVIIVIYYLVKYENKIKNGRELTYVFGLPCIREIKNKGNQEEKAVVQEEIEILCSRAGQDHWYLSLLTDSKSVEDYMESISENLREKKMGLTLGGNVAEDIESMKKVQEYKKIVLVCENRKTAYSSIYNVIQKCREWGIEAEGVVNFRW